MVLFEEPGCSSGVDGSHQSISAAHARAAANQLHLAASIDGWDRQTDGHSTVTETLTQWPASINAADRPTN